MTHGSLGKFSFPIISTFIPQDKCNNQLANFGHCEKSFNLFSNPKKGPITQASKLAIIPELK
jgi:hypothetical protein